MSRQELLDRFALAALPAVLAARAHTGATAADCARTAYGVARAMLAERDKNHTLSAAEESVGHLR